MFGIQLPSSRAPPKIISPLRIAWRALGRYTWAQLSATRVVTPDRTWTPPPSIKADLPNQEKPSSALFLYPAESWIKTHALASGRLGQSFQRVGFVKCEFSRPIQLSETPDQTEKQDLSPTISYWGRGSGYSVIQSAYLGADQGYFVNLQIVGVGYRAELDGDQVILRLGFSHVIKVPQNNPETGVICRVLEPTLIQVAGINKVVVHRTAARIRAFRKPDVYKGKGIRYVGEKVRIIDAKKKS